MTLTALLAIAWKKSGVPGHCELCEARKWEPLDDLEGVIGVHCASCGNLRLFAETVIDRLTEGERQAEKDKAA